MYQNPDSNEDISQSPYKINESTKYLIGFGREYKAYKARFRIDYIANCPPFPRI